MTRPTAAKSAANSDLQPELIASHGPIVTTVLNIPSHSKVTRVDVSKTEGKKSVVRIWTGKFSNISARDLLDIAKLEGPVELSVEGGVAGPGNERRIYEAFGKMPQLLKLHAWNHHYLGRDHFAGLSHSRSLKQLEVSYQSMSIDECQSLAKIESLESLTARGTALNNEKLEVLCSGLSNLTSLNIDSWTGGSHSFDNHGLPELLKLRKLKFLSVRMCKGLTDESIPHLSKMTWLEGLDVSKTSITTEGAERLRQALPDAKIASDGLKTGDDTATVDAGAPSGSARSNKDSTPNSPAVSVADDAVVKAAAVVKSDPVLVLTTELRKDAVGDVTVSLLGPDGKEVDTASTDSRGRAVFRNLPPGDYQFVCQSDYSGAEAAKKHRRGDLHRKTPGSVTVAESETTRHRVPLLPLRTVTVDYAEVVPSGDLVTLTAGNTRKSAIIEAVTPACYFPLTGMQNRTQSPIRVESAGDSEMLQLRCLPAGEIFDLGVVSFDKASATNDDWENAKGAKAAAVTLNHVYLIRHQDGRRFKLRISRIS